MTGDLRVKRGAAIATKLLPCQTKTAQNNLKSPLLSC